MRVEWGLGYEAESQFPWLGSKGVLSLFVYLLSR